MSHWVGGAIVVMPSFDAGQWLREVQEHRVTSAFIVPTVLRRLLDLGPETLSRHDTSSLRSVVIAAAKCPAQWKIEATRVFGDVFYEFYGSTEASVNTIGRPVDFARNPESCGVAFTGNEIRILDEHRAEIAAGIGPRAVLAEIASGSARKARIVLEALEAPAAYAPVDISEAMLAEEAAALRRDFPGLEVLPVAVDFSADFRLPAFEFDHRRIAIFYAGSSLGNLEPPEASAFLARVRHAAGPESRLLLGVDRKKDRATLERAYNDPEGLNAAFNRNILNNVNALADGDFVPERWIAHALYNEPRGRIELWLESSRDQSVHVAGETLRFSAGDRIHTENSYKFAVAEVLEAARPAWTPLHVWSDRDERFSVFLFAGG